MIRIVIIWDGENNRVEVEPPQVSDIETRNVLLGALKPIIHRIRAKEAESVVAKWLHYFRSRR